MHLIAHRGLHSKNTKENTLEAIELGDKNPLIDGVEIDVRLTKDNEVVVIHDDTIDRISDGKGRVNEMSLERLRRFNYGTIIKPSTINTLDEVLRGFSSNTILIIELKADDGKEELLANKVISIINKYPNLNIWLQSFSQSIIDYLKKHSHHPIGVLVNKNNINTLNLNVDFYAISEHIITKEMIKNLLNQKKLVLVWTICSSNDMRSLEEKIGNYLQNIYVISDNPIMYCK